MAVDIVILAAGKGTRMKSELPKVLHSLAGKPLLRHVLDAAGEVSTGPGKDSDKSNKVHVVIGHGAEKVQEQIPDLGIQFIVQQEQLGTGHAVQQVAPYLRDDSFVLVLCGDVPLIQSSTLQQMVNHTTTKQMALLTVDVNDPTGLGRIIRDENGNITAIVEHKDADVETRKICEINTGIMCIPIKLLKPWLEKLSNSNAQQEYYLTDVIAMAVAQGVFVYGLKANCEAEVQGINDRLQLARLERVLQKQQAEALMKNGVSIIDPDRIDIRGELNTGIDVAIDINCIFEGNVSLGNKVTISANCIIKNSTIGDNVEIKPNTIIEDSTIENNCIIGPFARIRPQTHLKQKAKVGNFVEVKKSEIGEGSKVSHLSYIGDAEIGKDANVGAGTITCNYDGKNKFKTTIRDGAFIGSNTALVAPVTVGKNTTVAAGSTITDDAPDDVLAIARGRQNNIEGWKKKDKK